MEMSSGNDLISLKESLQSHASPSTRSSPPSTTSAGQYARDQGLTIDSLLSHWPQLVEHDQNIAATVAGTEQGQLIEDGGLQECLFRAIIPTPEQWQLPISSLQILQQVCTECTQEEAADLALQQCFSDAKKWRSLKLDTPALRSDNVVDCRRLARRVKAFLKEPLPDHRLPLHPVDIEKGEGLEFPRAVVDMDKERTRDIEQEKLEVGRDTLVYLMQSLESSWSDKEQQEFTESVSTYYGVRAREPLTPPLSPLLETLPESFVPDDECCKLPESSDPSSRLSEDIEAAESRIFETDLDFWDEVVKADVSPSRYEDVDFSAVIRAGQFRPSVPPSSPQPIAQDLKVEVPLLPRSDDDHDTRNTTSVLAPGRLEEAKALVSSSDTLSASDGPGGQLISFFQGRAAAVMQSVEQEKLQPLDAIARVPVPVMDFSLPVPEWEERLWETKAMFRWIQKNTDVDWYGLKWTHNRAAEQRMMWAPLAHMKEKKLVSEYFDVDPEILAIFLERSYDAEVPTSADYIYKPPGLAILRQRDDEDEEEDYILPLLSSTQPESSYDEASWRRNTPTPLANTSSALERGSAATPTTAMTLPADLMTLLNGKKRVIDETIQTRQSSGKRPRDHEAPPPGSPVDLINQALIPSTNVLRGFMSEYTDFAPLVDNFVEMNFPKKPKLTHSSFVNPPTTNPSPTAQSKADEAARLMPPPPRPTPALAPEITPPAIPPRIVVSSAVSKLLTSHLSKLLPNIELIPRDYDRLRHTPGWFPGGVSNTAEADMVVSPATGILLTTMVQLRQKPVPGQATSSATTTTTTTRMGSNLKNNAHAAAAAAASFYRVTEQVAGRHERLVVLVSEGNKHSETASPPAQADARALAEFQGFAAGLGLRRPEAAVVQVVYVGGGVETLARWVAAVICRCAAREALLPVRHLLLPVETFWEVFLRRAGMNAYAAQVVLGVLKVPDDVPAIGGRGGQLFGLPLFVTMSRARRIELFEQALGGRKVLDRVSEAIDERWAERAVGEAGFDPGIFG